MSGAPGPNVIRTCKRCGDTYHPKSTRQECCNKPIKVPCVVCGKLMDQICTFKHQNETCSRDCAAQRIKQNRETSANRLVKICKYCGKEFHPKSVRDVYCEGPHYATCEVCGKQFEIRDILRPSKTCSDECRFILIGQNKDVDAMKASLKATLQERYGVDNPMQIPGSKEKLIATCKERYGTDWYTQTDEYKDKSKETDLQKYGVEHHLSSPEVIAKRQDTIQAKYGVDNVFQSEDIKAKSRETNMTKYGVAYASQSAEVKNNTRQHNLEKYGVEHPMMLPEYQEKAKQTNIEKFGFIAPTQAHISNIAEWYKFIDDPRAYIEANYPEMPRAEELAEAFGVDRSTIDEHLKKCGAKDCIRRAKSLMEEEVIQYIKHIVPGCKVIANDHTILNGSELDIYLPEYRFAIECDPTVTHNSSFPDPWGGDKKSITYHKRKTDICATNDIFLMHIFGYDWVWKKDIIKSMIANILDCSRVLYARKCEIVRVSRADAMIFLNQNHRQGFVSSSVYLGLTYSGELISLMAFGKMRSTIGIDQSDLTGCWELTRFCNKLGISVVGGASRLFKRFVSEYHPKEIRSFSDRAHVRGTLYSKLGFSELRQSDPNYVWVNVATDKAYHRANTQKRNLKRFLHDATIDLTQSEKQIMESHGFAQVYDSGTVTWQWKRQPCID